MTLRRGHGTGAGAQRIEVLPPDELPAATPAHTVRAERDDAGRFLRGNTVARMGRVRASQLGKLDGPKGDPRFRVLDRWGKRYAAARRRELAALFGGEISYAVAAIIESASLDLVAARYCQALAGEKSDPALLARASQHAQSARQHELAAWELAAREAEARKRTAPIPAWWQAPPERTRPSTPLQDGGARDAEGPRSDLQDDDDQDDLGEVKERLKAARGGRPLPVIEDDDADWNEVDR